MTPKVRFAPVQIPPPKGSKEAPIDLWAVHQVEPDSRTNMEPMEWLLLTNLPPTSDDESRDRARWTIARWGIEVFHGTLKTGCRIEDRQLCYRARLERGLALDSAMARGLHHLTMIGRVDDDLPCTVSFHDPKWRVLYGWHHHMTKLCNKPPTLGEAVRPIVMKRGSKGRKSYARSGVQQHWQARRSSMSALRCL